MKRITLLLLILILGLDASVRAATLLPYLAPVRAEVLNQLTLATNATPVNKKLAASLKTALKLIDKPGKTNLLNDTKLVGVLVPALNKTVVSNVFGVLLTTTVDDYLTLLFAGANNSSNTLALTYPSAAHTAAQKSLDALFALVLQANGALDDASAAKLLSRVAGKLAATDKAIDRAAKALAPPAGVTATVTGASKWTYKSTLAVATHVSTGSSLVNSTQPLLKAPYGQRTITLSLYGLSAGANVLNIGPADSSVLVTEFYADQTGAAYDSTSGTIHVTYLPATRSLVGTFTAVCVDQVDASREITINGSFSAITQ